MGKKAFLSTNCKLFVNREDFAAILGVSISSVDRGLKAKVPPFDQALRIGRRVLFPVSCISDFSIYEARDETK